MATRLFVGNLPENIEETDLQAAFSFYGDVKNLDLKCKSTGVESKLFAFVTISGSNNNIESCIKDFSSKDFNGKRLYVTRARESFLERLQRERLETQQKKAEKAQPQVAFNSRPTKQAEEKLNPLKRNGPKDDEPKVKRPENILEMSMKKHNSKVENKIKEKLDNYVAASYRAPNYHALPESLINDKIKNIVIDYKTSNNFLANKKKQDSDIKRLAAMKKTREEFKKKKLIVKTGLTGVDNAPNKKMKFSDIEDEIPYAVNKFEKVAKPAKRNTLFDDDNEDSGDELNFEIKKQFEGKGGQKVLDLQSRYKSDKRFVLDERFIEDDGEEATGKDQDTYDEQVEVGEKDEKAKQLNILQDVLGVPIRRKIPEEERDGKKNKPKLGMLRFDPSQPEHAKFLAPVEDPTESTKKSKKKKDKRTEITEVQERKQEEQRPEVSKEQFYKVSDTLKEAIAQPTSFSLRSLFGTTETVEEESKEENANYIPLEPSKKSKVKNPLQPGEKNPFVYDSSDSETEEVEKETKLETSVITESKAIWKENFFFGLSDPRFEEGLAFFNSANDTEAQKERRGLKSLMKKRIYNKERKDQMQMFQKKIGGRKKTMKKNFRRRN